MRRRAIAGSAVGLVVLLSGPIGCDELLPPGFPHRAHLTEDRCGKPGQMECPTCVSCHQSVRTDGSAPLMSQEVCAGCHQEEAAQVMSKVRSNTQKRTDITFSHERHLQRDIRGQCVDCHAGVVSDGVSGGVFPPMAACISCHEDGLQADACTSCHQRQKLRKLVPETFLRHDGNFMRTHGTKAVQSETTCNQCHAETDCARCHDQSQSMGLSTLFPEAVSRNLIHRADFVTRHVIEARSEPGTCTSCHTPSFCDSCHVERGVSGNRIDSINPHPLGWIGPDNTHGRAARRDITACASCHEAGPSTNCIRCHSVGGPGGNPHPSGWSSMRSPDAPMCRYCHGG